MLTLGIESSCDDTAVALLDNNRLLINLRSGQDNIHRIFGGVVPELASRQHLTALHPLLKAAFTETNTSIDDVEVIAATRGPGLVGSLLVGFSYAKAIAYVKKIPLVGVDHMAGHILSVFLEKKTPSFPYLSLIVSGGSTGLYLAKSFTDFECLGRTRDDAAGEAFDKVAKLLNICYPGGPEISRKAETGNSNAFSFPRAWLGDSLDFSFSGLKTAVRNKVTLLRQQTSSLPIEDICASFQEAVVEVLTTKTIQAAKQYKIKDICIGGGVSANNSLRQRFLCLCSEQGLHFYAPSIEFCTDNAAMIALAGQKQYLLQKKTENLLTQDVFSRSALGQ